MNVSTLNQTEVLGQPAVHIVAPDGAQATVLLHGAHVVSWVPAGAHEQLYLSPTAVAGPGRAVRGGVPVIFPQFEQMGPDTSLPRHGFARTRAWEIDSHHRGREHSQVTLALHDDADTRALWPHGFRLELTVSVGARRLDLELFAENTGQTPWPFAAALHTYLAVSNLANVRLQGLEGCRYRDRLLGGSAVEDHPEKRFHGEMDRIYSQVPDLLLRDGPRRLSLRSDNLPDAVVWNPGPQKCAAMNDMPAGDWEHMLCVEAARIESPLTLQPGETWAGLHTLVLAED
ncbi:D-hexose-6-phosphate mutarotase [Aquabacterium fontiphilum]|jgi:glucose-6-phosphate 1-epimerase|uniref:D-hexose-6-phosphate mutarotase n=1 Tax=Aquabacterium fontiphilum TaxID=450365 RepID=UPI0013775DD5|nr:D-hexose-6-phosphate mutarotase [Aquabacterium fontiphilum]NBD20248.1 D-hexose-6-phosphate mutarotase [Aquabacterium fontiphilum]